MEGIPKVTSVASVCNLTIDYTLNLYYLLGLLFNNIFPMTKVKYLH